MHLTTVTAGEKILCAGGGVGHWRGGGKLENSFMLAQLNPRSCKIFSLHPGTIAALARIAS